MKRVLERVEKMSCKTSLKRFSRNTDEDIPLAILAAKKNDAVCNAKLEIV